MVSSSTASAVRIFEISNRIKLLQYSIRFETSTIIQNFRILNRHRFLTYLTEWRRLFTSATTPSNQQNLLLTMVQVLYLSEVFILAHYGPPSSATPTTTIVQCQKTVNLFNKYLLLVTFETNDNYSIRFRISNNGSTILFDSIRNEKKQYSHRTN